MNPTFKNTALLFFLVLGFSAQAQHLTPPKTYWQSFGYQKQPDHVQTVQYKSDSLGYEPTVVLVKSFNKEGFLIQDYTHILGNFASETAHNYVYKNGVLDSINTLTTNQDFSSTRKLNYNPKGQLVHIISTGKHTEYTDTFTYYENGMVKTIQRRYKDESTTTTSFDHKKNVVTETDKRGNGKISTTTYVYNLDELFATIDDKNTIRFHNTYHNYDFEVQAEGDALQYAIEKRRLFQQDEQYLGKLSKEKNGKIVFDIPAISRNDNGDIIRQLQLDKTSKQTRRRLWFSKCVYADGTTSGSTDYDLLFGQRVEKMK